MMAIENLADKCRGRLDPPLEEMDVDQKLHIVKVTYALQLCWY